MLLIILGWKKVCGLKQMSVKMVQVETKENQQFKVIYIEKGE